MKSVAVRMAGTGTVSLPTEEVRAYSRSLAGGILLPGDPGYESARRVWNGMYDRRPALIFRCESETDIVAGVTFAAQHHLALAVKGGGHSIAGHSTIEGGVLIDLSSMRGVTVDPAKRVAHVQPGALWADVDRATQEHGLMTPGGEVSITGVAGLTLGGGMGIARRQFGLSCDNLLNARLVLATGEVVTASASENEDLFWAIRGGGGNFGVASSFTFQLHELGREVFHLSVAYPWTNAEEVMTHYRDIAESMPKEVTTNLALWSIPPVPLFPEELHGTPFVLIEGLYAGNPELGAHLMHPFRALAEPLWDETGTKTYIDVQSAFDPFFNDGDRYFFKSHFVTDLTDSAIQRILHWATNRTNPRCLFVLRHLGGAVEEVPEEATAFANRGARYNLSIDNSWSSQGDDQRNVAWTRACWSDLEDIANGGVYLNFVGEEASELVEQGMRSNLLRLAELKRVYDPENLFNNNPNIRSASVSADPVA